MRARDRTLFIQERLPKPQSLAHLSLENGDVVIHAPGFEDRTLAVIDSLRPVAGSRAILLDYLPYLSKNRLPEVRDGLRAAGIEIDSADILSYNRFDPNDFEPRLKNRLVQLGARGVVVDISTMSKLAILLILNVCWDLDLNVRILYAEAQEYGPTEDQFSGAKESNEIHQPSIQIYTGVHGVVRVDSLASVAMQGQPTAALVFMSFNDTLTQVLLNTIYPSRLFLINGRPPIHRWREKATAWIHNQVRSEWKSDNPVGEKEDDGVPLPKRSVSTLDYRETVSLLVDLYWELSTHHRLLLAPAGSKMQAVGCYIVKALHPDIHIEYPSPEGFLRPYSSGIGPQWIVDFGRLPVMLDALSTLERREYLEIPMGEEVTP